MRQKSSNDCTYNERTYEWTKKRKMLTSFLPEERGKIDFVVIHVVQYCLVRSLHHEPPGQWTQRFRYLRFSLSLSLSRYFFLYLFIILVVTANLLDS